MDLAMLDLDAPMAEQAAAMAAACETVGFFALPMSVIDRSIADDAWNSAAEFFAQSDEDKRSIQFPEAGYPYGYSPFGFETLAKSLSNNAAGPDLKESLSVGPDCAVQVETAKRSGVSGPQSWIHSPSLWPERPTELRESWRRYYQALAKLSEQLMSVMAVALDLPANYFESMIDRPISSMRALHYPALNTAEDLKGSLRAGAHSDYGTLTILRTDDVPGLEIQEVDGTWTALKPEPNTFIVNLGDSIAQWTNDQWRSTVHRVAVTDGAARHSFAFFHMANWDSVIECLPTCQVPGEPPHHDAVEAGPWLMRKFTSTIA